MVMIIPNADFTAFCARQAQLTHDAWESVLDWRKEHDINVHEGGELVFITLAPNPALERRRANRTSVRVPPVILTESEITSKFDSLRRMIGRA